MPPLGQGTNKPSFGGANAAGKMSYERISHTNARKAMNRDRVSSRLLVEKVGNDFIVPATGESLVAI